MKRLSGERAVLLGVAGILGAHVALLAWIAVVNAPTLDEPFHLAAGVRRWTTGRFDIDRGTPPFVSSIAAIPVLAAGAKTDWHRVPNSFQVGSDFLRANGARSFQLMTMARWMLLPLSALGGLVCFLWARDLWGTRAAFVVVTLWSLCPQVLALGSVVTGDMAATALGVSTMYAFWKWLRHPSWHRALNFGVLLGLAELTKLVWLVLYPLCFALWLAWQPWQGATGRTTKSLTRQVAQGLVALVLSIDIINMAYVFAGFGRPLREFVVGHRVIEWVAAPAKQLGVPHEWLGQVRVPFPADYVRGLDEVISIVENASPSYLRGQYREGGWWYYYLYGWLVKLPLGTWAVIMVAAAASTVGWARPVDNRAAPLLLVVAATVLAFVTFKSGMQFLRYSLPALPFVLVWAGRAAAPDHKRPRRLDGLVLACVAWSAASSLLVFPHSLSYFNALGGGPSNGARHLLDDSYDWGQDLLFLRRWLQDHPEAHPLRLAYLGWTDPGAAGIRFTLPPRRPEIVAGADPALLPPDAGLGPGWYAVSAGIAYGTPFIPIHDGTEGEAVVSAGDFAYFQNVTPVARAGYSIGLYYLDEEAIAHLEARGVSH